MFISVLVRGGASPGRQHSLLQPGCHAWGLCADPARIV